MKQVSNQEVDDRFFKIARESDEHARALLQGLSEDAPLELTVLRGHLMVERMLWRTLEAYAINKNSLGKARLNFAQICQLVRAFSKMPIPEVIWQVVLELNKLRNCIAHQLDPSNQRKLVDGIASLTRTPELGNTDRTEASDSEKIRLAVYFIVGGLSVLETANTVLADNTVPISSSATSLEST